MNGQRGNAQAKPFPPVGMPPLSFPSPLSVVIIQFG